MDFSGRVAAWAQPVCSTQAAKWLDFPVLLLIQFFIFYLQERFEWVASINGYLFAAVYITGLAFLWLNRHHTGFMLIWIGVFLNFAVMAVNGGRMPVSVEASAVLGPYYVDMLRKAAPYQSIL